MEKIIFLWSDTKTGGGTSPPGSYAYVGCGIDYDLTVKDRMHALTYCNILTLLQYVFLCVTLYKIWV